MSVSPNFVNLEPDFAIDGGLNAEGLAYLANNYKSILYICPDEPTDTGCEGGFAAITQAIAAKPEMKAAQVSLSTSEACFQVNCAEDPVAVMRKFAQFEHALDDLPRPTAIVCKTNRRAGCVYAAYKAVKNFKSATDTLATSTSQGLTYPTVPGLVAWIDAVTTITTPRPLIFRQMFEPESSTYTFLLADEATKEAILIDPVLETVGRDLQIIKSLGLNLLYMLNTHVHADHITGTGSIKQILPNAKSVIAAVAGAVGDIQMVERQVIKFGSRSVHCFNTPGHTAGCFTFVLDDFRMVFTGDAVLIHGCGRTDFQGGSAQTLYRVVHEKIFSLPNMCVVYPAHDYQGLSSSSIAEERAVNPRLNKPEEEFVALMGNLNLPYPRKLEASLPANFKCGVF